MVFDDLDDHAASRVQASPAVARLLGAEALTRLRTEAFRRYTCCTCGQPGKTDAEPATVIVQRYRLGSIKVRLVHARCADSQIADVSADTPDPAALGGMLSKSAVLEYASGPRVRPLLSSPRVWRLEDCGWILRREHRHQLTPACHAGPSAAACPGSAWALREYLVRTDPVTARRWHGRRDGLR
jgi:hypothetical protein